MKDNEQKAIEVIITAALINVANEQAEMVKGLYKHRHKQKLNAWINMGNSLMDGLKKSFTDAEVDILDGMTDVYHEQSDSIRKQIKESK
tara:strand:- start:16 stop:282 length:267 start_codon:yes stop_codon:yes gene_type:complete